MVDPENNLDGGGDSDPSSFEGPQANPALTETADQDPSLNVDASFTSGVVVGNPINGDEVRLSYFYARNFTKTHYLTIQIT